MSNLIWRIKKFFNDMIPYVIVGALLYGSFQLYRKGTFRAFRHGIIPGVTAVLKQVPYFGKRFGHYSYSYHKKHHHRKHRHHRHRRHRR